jgi:LysR family hydrogen peroxide-inducible transcriptional activator
VIAINRPTVAQLRAFLALAEHLHFREAAAALRLSQPGLSGAIAALEDTLGVQLVERTTRKVMLTPAGERVAHRAERVMAELDRLVADARAVRGPLVGPLRLGVIPTVAPYLLPVLLPVLAERFPHLRLSVQEQQTDSLMEDMQAGRLDVTILALPSAGRGFAELPLYAEDFVLVAPAADLLGGLPGGFGLLAAEPEAARPLAGRPPAELPPLPREVLSELDVLLLNEGHCLRDQALDVCREVGARAIDATYATSLATLVRRVAGGLGVTLVPESALPVEVLRSDRLTVRRFEPAPHRRIGVVHRVSSPRGPEFDVLAQSVRAAVRKHRWNVRVS